MRLLPILALLLRSCQAQGNPAPAAAKTPVYRGWTAFGDSYAAGVGAGAAYGNSGDCRRREGSYPFQLNNSPVLAANQNHEFEFIACSGATINNILRGGDNSQVDQFRADAVDNKDIATLSISGNDIGFVSILDACIVDWTIGGPSCATVLQRADFALAGIQARTVSAINDILQASNQNGGSSTFQVYVTGEPFLTLEFWASELTGG